MTSSYHANASRIPQEIEELRRASGLATRQNIQCYVLDPQGRVLRGFTPFPERAGDGMRPGGRGPVIPAPDEFARLLRDEIARAGSAPDPERAKRGPATLRLPELPGKGIRVYARFEGGAAPHNYRTPVVDAVGIEAAEREALAYPAKAREVEADRLRRWFQPCFPPAMMEEQSCTYRGAKGALALRPVSADRAVLSGRITLVMDDPRGTEVEGAFEAVLTYEKESLRTLRGVFEGGYSRQDPFRPEKRPAKVSAAFEALPD